MMQQNHTNGRLTDRERTPARLIVLRVLFTLFAAGTVVFIFSNSMQSGAASGLRSAAVTQWLNGGLARMGLAGAFPSVWCASWAISANTRCWASG